MLKIYKSGNAEGDYMKYQVNEKYYSNGQVQITCHKAIACKSYEATNNRYDLYVSIFDTQIEAEAYIKRLKKH